MPLSARELLRLVRLALIITAVWLCLGLFFGWHHHTINRGRTTEPLAERLAGMSAAMLLWAIATPLVFAVADRLPLRRPHLFRNMLLIAAFAAAVALARAAVDVSLSSISFGERMNLSGYRASVAILFHTHLLFAVLLVGVANFMRLEREEQERRAAAARLEAQLAEARLRQLGADLHPHFLFNTLNAVAALLHSDPAAAEETLQKLRELLRASIAVEAVTEVRLADELAFIERYFDIQKMRLGEKLTTAIHVSDARLRDAAVPPLLLQPFVENSIVHGIGTRRGGGSVAVLIDTTPALEGEWLRVQVRDDGPGCEPKSILARGSVGVPNAVARLQSIYGKRQRLRYTGGAGGFIAEILIPLKVAA